ncbi:hypothetical protein, partial [Cellulomonas sp. NPDC058312]|uniref:Gp37-like protein n=1 Tax=Cellulomonas sp. NPDC058312 TaxID=3346441 RepID=UPI0036E1FF4C
AIPLSRCSRGLGFVYTRPLTDKWLEAFVDVDVDAAIPIIVDLPGYQTVWFVTEFDEVEDEDGSEYLEVIAINAWEYINRTVFWASPAMPAEFQLPKEWIGIGPAISLIKYWYILPNLARLQAPFFSLPDGDLLNLQSWNLLRNAQWPLMVKPTSVIHDTSNITAMATRFENGGDAIVDILKTEGLQLTFDLYIHGESEQPFPEIMELTRTTMLIDIVQKADLRAFTGTVIDGIIRTGLEILDDGLSWLAYPILDQDDYSDYFQNLFGTLPYKPWIVYHKGTCLSSSSKTHKPMASRATVGGKSPGWVNKAAVAASNALLGYLGLAIGIPGLAIGIFEDEVKDVAMAFHTWEDRPRAIRAGPWRFREVFKECSSGLSLDALAAIKTALWENRGWVSHRITVTNGKPFYVGLHMGLGSPIGYEKRGKIQTDYLYAIDYEDSDTKRGKLEIEIGDGTTDLEPGALALGKIRRFGAFANKLALAS